MTSADSLTEVPDTETASDAYAERFSGAIVNFWADVLASRGRNCPEVYARRKGVQEIWPNLALGAPVILKVVHSEPEGR